MVYGGGGVRLCVWGGGGGGGVLPLQTPAFFPTLVKNNSSRCDFTFQLTAQTIQDLKKNIKNVKGCRDGMPKSMQTR